MTRDEPFFSARGGDPAAPRLLLVSDQFPPAQSAGALRWQKLAGFAYARGWELDVLTRDPSGLGVRDDSRLAELPPGTRVYGLPFSDGWLMRAESRAGSVLGAVKRFSRSVTRDRGAESDGDSEALARSVAAERARDAAASVSEEGIHWRALEVRSWLRAYWSWRDYHRQGRWARELVASGMRIAATSQRHVAVISCGPWHFCNHESGRVLSRKLGIPFIMDLRDPWSLERRVAETIASPLWFALARRHERHAVEASSLVVTNAEPVRQAMAARYPRAADRFLTITNGYDEEEVPRTRLEKKFVIAYAGGIYLDRDPRPVFRAAKCVVEALDLTPEQFGIEMIGNVDTYGGVPIDRMAEEEGLGGYVRTGPARPRTEALEFLSHAAMLLSLPQDSPWAIPSKIFEYMQFDAWMLVLADPDAPAALLLKGTQANVAPPGDVDAIAAAIRARYAEFASGGRPVRIGLDERFSRRYQAERLMDALSGCIPGEGGAGARRSLESRGRESGLTRMEARC